MRESTYSSPHVNRAVLTVQTFMYDRRALDSNSPIALLCSLTSLTHLTSTSPRIREVLTKDGGLERLLDILRDASVQRVPNPPPDLWGLNGPSTARIISWDRQIGLRHSLAFQSIVNIGVRGSEAVRTRVVQSGALDMVAQILEMYLMDHDIVVQPSTLGSREAVAQAAQTRRQAQEPRRSRTTGRQTASDGSRSLTAGQVAEPARDHATAIPAHTQPAPRRPAEPALQPVPQQVDTDVEMADTEQEGASDVGSLAGDNAMDVDTEGTPLQQMFTAAAAATPRASNTGLPRNLPAMPIDVPERPVSTDDMSGQSSTANSLSEGNDSRAVSDQETTGPPQPHRPPPLNLAVQRVPGLAQGDISNQSSPMGTPTRMEPNETFRAALARRDTIVARPVALAVSPARLAGGDDDPAGSGASDAGGDVDRNRAAIDADLAAGPRDGVNAIETQEPVVPPNVEIVDMRDGMTAEEPDAEALAAEQARLDMEAGAPPGQPGNINRTPPVVPTVVTTENAPAGTEGAAAAAPAAAAPTAVPGTGAAQAVVNGQVIIANGAPRGFHDLGSYVGISTILNPENNRFAEDSVLLALQLLAYLSKYPHVRNAFHHPRRPMHPTFDLGPPEVTDALPARPVISQSTNIFSLVERYTFRCSAADPKMFMIPKDVHYWAGVIMRNACRKDEQRGGIRQCAYMSCGKWETFAREFAKCRRCRKAKYCSKECQSKGWAEGHRFWCNIRSDDATDAPDAAPPVAPASAEHEALRAQLANDPVSVEPVIAQMPPHAIPDDILGISIQLARFLFAEATEGAMNVLRIGMAGLATPEGVPLQVLFTATWVHGVLEPLLGEQTPAERVRFCELLRQRYDFLRDLLINSVGPGPLPHPNRRFVPPPQRALTAMMAQLHARGGGPPQAQAPELALHRLAAAAAVADAQHRPATTARLTAPPVNMPDLNGVNARIVSDPQLATNQRTAPGGLSAAPTGTMPRPHRQAGVPFAPNVTGQPSVAAANAATDAANLAAAATRAMHAPSATRPMPVPELQPPPEPAAPVPAPATAIAPRSGGSRSFLSAFMRMGGRNQDPPPPPPDAR